METPTRKKNPHLNRKSPLNTYILSMSDAHEFETETTFNVVDIGFVWAVLKAWISRRKLTIKNPHTRITMTSETGAQT